MAHSKSGGTRSYIRGKIGADVYSIGKDGKGKRQQVVRSLAEQVSNPQTEAQMKGRMYMSTVMQAVSALSPIIDHSFDNVPNGQPSISEFISRNYALIKTDAEAHAASGNQFGLNKYQEKGAKYGKYVVAKGDIQVPSSISFNMTDECPSLVIAKTSGDDTAGEIRAKLGLPIGDYITLLFINGRGKLFYARYYVSSTLADDTVITASNVAQLFTVETNGDSSIELDTEKVTLSVMGVGAATEDIYGGCGAFIISQKVAGAWKHNTSEMTLYGTTNNWTSAVALPTYPQGQARFLNGGDI